MPALYVLQIQLMEYHAVHAKQFLVGSGKLLTGSIQGPHEITAAGVKRYLGSKLSGCLDGRARKFHQAQSHAELHTDHNSKAVMKRIRDERPGRFGQQDLPIDTAGSSIHDGGLGKKLLANA